MSHRHEHDRLEEARRQARWEQESRFWRTVLFGCGLFVLAVVGWWVVTR